MGAMSASNLTSLLINEQSAPLVDGDGRTLIEFFLQDQQQLTAVERFSRLHDVHTPPLHEPLYRDLIPLSTPQKNEQYAFEVDLDACTGCKACVTACHSMNGLDDDEVWRTVGLLQGGSERAPIFQTVTAACHHCAHPACMLGCPAKAYAKDDFTGIVKHLDDQCIGCQYCVLKCPYDVPKYNSKRGIVRKCDMCSSRLAEKEAPACVQACPNTAIKITLVNKDDIAERSANNEFLPGAPAPDYTQPATIYKKKHALPYNTVAADLHRAAPEPGHFPLVVMLVLTQLSVGAFALELLSKFASFLPDLGATRPAFAAAAFLAGFIGLNSAIFHLGRPLYAFRAVLGFKTSWMSREIVAFSAYLLASGAYAASFFAPKIGIHVSSGVASALQATTILTGVAGVICSMMIYIDTRREFWKAPLTAVKFTLTTLVLGLAAMLFFAALKAYRADAPIATGIKPVCAAIAALALFKMLHEGLIFRHLRKRAPYHPLKKSALLMVRELVLPMNLRFTLGAIGGVILPLMLLGPGNRPGVALSFAAAVCAFTLLTELLERSLFFRAVVALKMPGGSAE
ncbi:MAG TPA: DmsC/YnfH family molybdoenzyme membrane anchor subunit [Planctomycetota bacterium]|nr:DmsC/YnfH family molybdoenzyme membrane anchor subunit [Planctomycetota bacterium]